MSDLKGEKIHYDGNASAGWKSSYVLGTGKDKITGSDKYSYKTTVENIQSSIGVHEYSPPEFIFLYSEPLLKNHALHRV